ncbi:hypothetical protein [Nakamurella aerolata]|uniref:WD40 repeat protein n=1 Tax=Nakamurella aerolata TaxID=1656892 RepID=A0A849ACC1_9ACTN|nr:hypothetical protein [Nakamurella aerolata]NNG37363.1 hypothetical protein [Nakamurella aerolata]
MVITDRTIITMYIDAVAEFDRRSGTLLKLLAAQRSDSPMFAAQGALAVTPRCDSALVVHRNGCQVGELVGHRMPADVRPAESFGGMHFVEDATLISLGADGTLRRWDVAGSRLLGTREVSGGAIGTRLLVQPGTGELLLSRRDGVVALRTDSLEPKQEWGPFTPTTSGWVPVSADTCAGIVGRADDADRQGLLLRKAGGSTDEFIDTHDAPRSLAVSAQGALAFVVGRTLYHRLPSGQLRTLELAEWLYQVEQSAFSSDGKLLFAQDARRGVRMIDVATGENRGTLRGPQ